MGIEDLNLDLSELAERVLVISESSTDAERIGHLLEKRGYAWSVASDLESAAEAATDELFDIVIRSCDKAMDTLSAIGIIAAHPVLKRSPLLFIHPNANEVPNEYLESLNYPVRIMGAPFDPSRLLLNVSSQLRERKIANAESRVVSRISLQNAELRDLTNRFKRELQEAQNIQNAIMPKSLPAAENALFASTYVPFEAVGGDIYDIWKINEDFFGVFIGDVTGHGLSAAFIGAMTKMALTYAPKESPEEMLAAMNDGLVDLMPEGRFVTASVAFFRPSTGELLSARAGHPAAYLYRHSTRELEEIAPRGLPLGVIPGSQYELYKTQLQPRDKFLFVTDGLTEAVNMEGAVLGTAGFGNLFKEVAPQARIDECLQQLLLKQEAYSEGRLIKDDITMIGLEKL